MRGRLKAPFPWFGGKSKVAHLVWERFGDVANYVEPFAGSLAVMLARPHAPRIETVNDLDCYISNFWRSVKNDPELVALWADWPVNEADLHARHLWLVKRDEFRERMKSDCDYYDAKIAGWWVWGISCWIGSGWCSRPEWNGRINASRRPRGIHAGASDVDDAEENVHQKMPRCDRGGAGVANVALSGPPEQRNARLSGQNGWRKRPNLGDPGKGVRRQLPDLGGDGGAAGRGVHASGRTMALVDWMERLADRLQSVRVCCGNWDRILGPAPTTCIGTTGVFLDPPYGADRDSVYAHDSFSVAAEVLKWAIENGNNPELRIALCGYSGEHALPNDWMCYGVESQWRLFQRL